MKLHEKTGYLNNLLVDLRAEYLVSCLLDEGLKQNRIYAVFEGILKRRWTTDIDFVELVTFEDNAETLSLHLNRPGIYDALPEALFHEAEENRNATGDEMAKESMRLNNEEKQARQFFNPFENEIFNQNVLLTKKENQKHHDLLRDALSGLSPNFWKINQSIPEDYSSKLISLLPYVSEIVGNCTLTAEALTFILQESVTVELEFTEGKSKGSENSKSTDNTGKLGMGVLGKDLIMGNACGGFIGRMLFKIGPLQNTLPSEYRVSGKISVLLDTFMGFFTPMEYDVDTQLILDEESKSFALGDGQGEGELSYLGFNAVL